MKYLIAIAMLFVVGCATTVDTMDDKSGDAMMTDDMMEDNSMTENTMMEDDDAMMVYSGNVIAGTTTPYIEFNKADYEEALENGDIILLNFYASWCPVCQAEQPEAFAAFNGLDLDNVVGFRVNYKDSDTDSYEQDLAKEFGITYQHTKVILKDGVRVLKAPDSWDSERYIEEIEKVA